MVIRDFFKKNRSYFIVGGLTVSILLLIFFLVRPALRRLNEDAISVQKKTLDIQIKKEKISKIPELKQKFDTVDAGRDKLNVLFSKNDIVDLVKELEYMAENTNNDISIKVPDENDKKPNKKLSKKTEKDNLLKGFKPEEYFELQINLTGNYESLLRFIYKLNNMHYYNKVVEFNIYTDEIDVQKNNLENNDFKNINLFQGNISKSKYDIVNEKRKILRANLKVIFYLKK